MNSNKHLYLDEDVQLMLKVADGDEDAFNTLYRKYFQIVTDYTTSSNGHFNSSEEITNEVFKRVWDQRAKYQPTSTLKTYLFTFVGIVMLEHQRRCRYQQSTLKNYSKMIIAEQSAADAAVQYNRELIEIIEKAKGKLSEKQQQAIELAFYSNISIDEAAKLADCSNSVFRRRICDAKKRLSALLECIY
ncbi:RNA polymerase sigma factor [Planctomycetota bacterium]